jgi:hypothetical protein
MKNTLSRAAHSTHIAFHAIKTDTTPSSPTYISRSTGERTEMVREILGEVKPLRLLGPLVDRTFQNIKYF